MNAPVRIQTGVERAAVLMMLVGEDEAAASLQTLEPEEVQQLGKAMFSGADVSEDEVSVVLDDFVEKARERTTVGFDPRPHIETMMTRALGADKAESVLAKITPIETACQIELLDWMDPPEIVSLIKDEHPQIAAVLLANLDASIAAQVLEGLPEASQPQILHRIAKLGPITPEAIDTLKSSDFWRASGSNRWASARSTATTPARAGAP